MLSWKRERAQVSGNFNLTGTELENEIQRAYEEVGWLILRDVFSDEFVDNYVTKIAHGKYNSSRYLTATIVLSSSTVTYPISWTKHLGRNTL